MKNEPVAWINLERWKDTSSYLEDCVADMKLESAGIVIPLYTHPVKDPANEVSSLIALTCQYKSMLAHPVKELTDEEIKELAYQHRWNGDVEFARAILRKAQEK